MEAGCEVVVVGSSASALSVAEEFRSKGFACHGLAVDLSQREQRRAGFAQAVELLGGHLVILVNGAGIQRRHFCEEFPIEDWDAVLEVNLTATFDLDKVEENRMSWGVFRDRRPEWYGEITRQGRGV